MARHQPKPLRKGLPVDLESLRTPRLTKAPDVDPVLIQPASRLAVVPDVPTPDESAPEAGPAAETPEAGNTDVSATPSEPEGEEGGNVENAGVSPMQSEPVAAAPAQEAPQPDPDETTVSPAVEPEVAAPAVQHDSSSQGGGVAADRSQPAPTASVEAPPRKSSGKITIQLKPEEAARVRAAFANLPAKVRPRSLGAFAAVPIMEYVRQIEEEYNGGEPFDPIEPGVLPTGRPLGS